MHSFIDFSLVKEAVSFAQAVSLLDLDMKKAGNQYRGSCPVCSGDKRSLVITEGRGFYCFGAKAGGDVIALAAHILDVSAKAAAQELAERAGLMEKYSTSKSTSTGTSSLSVPESEEGKRGLVPLGYLEPDHDLVVALGFDPAFCKSHGVGYAPRGVCRGSVAIPFRDEHGVLLGYLGVQELTYLPPDFQTNVVPFAKKRA